MKEKTIWSYVYAPRRWMYEFLKRAETMQSPPLFKTVYKWWNPFFNLNVVRDVMKTYGEAVAYVNEKGYKRVLDVGCAFGVGTWLLNGDGVEAWGIDIEDHKIEYASKLFPEVRYVLIKPGETIDERFDAVVCSYSFSPQDENYRDLLFGYADVVIYHGDDPPDGERIGKKTFVATRGGEKKNNYGFRVRYSLRKYLGLLQGVIAGRRTGRRKIIGCPQCGRMVYPEDLKKTSAGELSLACRHCGAPYPDVAKVLEKGYGFEGRER